MLLQPRPTTRPTASAAAPDRPSDTHRHRKDGLNLSRPYQAQISREGKMVWLGSYKTAEEAALCVAWTPEGQWAAAAAAQAAAAAAATAATVAAAAESPSRTPPVSSTAVSTDAAVAAPSSPPLSLGALPTAAPATQVKRKRKRKGKHVSAEGDDDDAADCDVVLIEGLRFLATSQLNGLRRPVS